MKARRGMGAEADFADVGAPFAAYSERMWFDP